MTVARPTNLTAPQATTPQPKPAEGPAIRTERLNAWYGTTHAVGDVTFEIPGRSVTAIIGPSGCGKSTLLRCLNRMHEITPGARVEGQVFLGNEDIYWRGTDAVEVRGRVGMVFQRPNPFPMMSVYENVAAGPRLRGWKRSRSEMDEMVERNLGRAALWGEVKDKLRRSGAALSGGQQQRLCIARAIAVQPDVILLDEPASALDPISTQAIEDLMQELKQDYTLVIVTHNMQQAARVAEMTAFFSLKVQDDGSRYGILVEYDSTEKIFTQPSDERTEGYVTGRFG
jgi:phosphate transport system ATP-binding protein